MVTTTLPKPEARERAARIIKRSGAVAQAEPAPYRFTAEQVLRMSELGIFHPDERLELIEGEIVYMVPPGSEHNYTNTRAADAFFNTFRQYESATAFIGSIEISNGDMLVPDLALIKPRGEHYRYAVPTPEDVLLVVEVSHSTLRFDRTRKLALYAGARIPAYWILNIADNVLEAHSDPVGDEYATRRIYRPGDTITLANLPEITIEVNDLLP